MTSADVVLGTYSIANARPLHPLTAPITDPEQITRLDIRKHDRLGGILHEYQHAA
jgi:putative transposase